MSRQADELHHLIKQAAQQQSMSYKPFVYGHIASYDPKTHRVRVMIPSLRDENGTPVISPWMPLGSIWVGNGFGFQWAPHGGASVENPTAGEPCEIHIIERRFGSSLAAHLIFNQVLTPPDQALAPGEGVFRHESGSLLKFTKDGDVLLTTHRDLVATIGRDLTAAVARNLTATVTGTAAVWASAIKLGGSAMDTLHTLCTHLFALLYNSHTHGNVQNGSGTSGPPNQQADNTHETAILTAD